MNLQLRIEEAKNVLTALGLPKRQQNERSALCLLALIDLTGKKKWSNASNPLIGITPIMDWMRKHYRKVYAPNSRETIRRQTIHQFLQAGIVLINPDNMARPTNSGDTVYQIEPNVLNLLKTFGTLDWSSELESYLKIAPSLAERYAKARELVLVPVVMPSGATVMLSPGEHSELIKSIVEQFAPRFAPGSNLVYVGDTGDKFGYYDEKILADLGININSHGKMPDVILFLKAKNWLFLIESVTSHGPVDSKRHIELEALFSSTSAGLVYVTAFPNRSLMAEYLPELAWETEVWVADAPSHMIHFDGERFLGP